MPILSEGGNDTVGFMRTGESSVVGLSVKPLRVRSPIPRANCGTCGGG